MWKGDIKKYLLAKTAHRFCDAMGLKEIVEPQRRKNGMTSSGRPKQCHQNVGKLVACYGGKQVLGYLLNYSEELETYGFIPHSIWETPEGKWVEVTSGIDKPFSPLVSFNPLKNFYHSPFLFTISRHIHEGFQRFSEQTGWKKFPMKCLKKNVRENHLFFRDYPYFREGKSEYWNSDSFTEPSSATGKYINEMFNNFLIKQNIPPLNLTDSKSLQLQ